MTLEQRELLVLLILLYLRRTFEEYEREILYGVPGSPTPRGILHG